MKFSSLPEIGSYLFYQVLNFEPLEVDTVPFIIGAPELDYFVFREDLLRILNDQEFFPDEIEEILNTFEEVYCTMYHLRFYNSCNFPSDEFSKYAQWIAKLIISLHHPLSIIKYFPEFVTINNQ